MIIKVWGIVNSTRVDFHPKPDKEDYWEGIAPRVKGLQQIEIWAENDRGLVAIGMARSRFETTAPTSFCFFSPLTEQHY